MSGQSFFERRHGIGVMADDSHHRESEHDERDMPVPAMPGAGLVVIEAEFVLGGFETVLYSPTVALHRDELFQGRAFGAPSGEESKFAIGDIAADKKTSRPLAIEGAVVFSGVEISEFNIGPIVQTRPFGSLAGRQALPGALGKSLCDLRRGTTNEPVLAPAVEHMIAGDAQN